MPLLLRKGRSVLQDKKVGARGSTYDFTMSPDPRNQLPDYRPEKPPQSVFSRRRKHCWLILRDLCQFCAQLSPFQ